MPPAVGKNPIWNRDEHILALDFYLSCKPDQPKKHSDGVGELSRLLQRLHLRLGTVGEATLRNRDGVYMKLMNLSAHDPALVASGRKGLPRGNRLEADVWKEFGSDRERLSQLAESIRAFIASSEALDVTPESDDEALAPEGQVLTCIHRRYERKRENRRRKVNAFLKAHGRVFCEACGFDFEATYGERGRQFIEVHHIAPVSSLLPGVRLKLDDLCLLCANCHRIVHRGKPWLPMPKLRELIDSARAGRHGARAGGH